MHDEGVLHGAVALQECRLEKLKAEAECLGKGARFTFAFYMGRQKEERERVVAIAGTKKDFYTEKGHYTIIGARRPKA